MPDEILTGQTSPGTTPPGRPNLPLRFATLVIGPLVLGLLVVVVLIALALRGAKAFDNSDGRRPMEADLQDLSVALKSYEANFGRYPPPPNASLVRALQGDGGSDRWYWKLLKDQISPSGELVDRWQRPLVYKLGKAADRAGVGYRLYSLGPNGVDEDGKGDDIAAGN